MVNPRKEPQQVPENPGPGFPVTPDPTRPANPEVEPEPKTPSPINPEVEP